MKLSLAFSTCPNDTFIFDALANRRIDTKGFAFDVMLADINKLNIFALEGNVDIVKVSSALYPLIHDSYQLLTSGGAMGYGVGPLVISKRKIYPDELSSARIAIPGIYTTANLLFSIAFPQAKNKAEYLFSDIEEALLSNEVDAGVIIHENRFTYKQKGLIKIIDLGDYWEKETSLPIPLGCIAIRRDLDLKTKQAINFFVGQSVRIALDDPQATYPYVKKFAQTMDVDVMEKHISLYVNDYSLNLNSFGRNALVELVSRAIALSGESISINTESIFVE